MKLCPDKVLPYYHPTTVVFVDDDPEILRVLDTFFDRTLLCRTYDDPAAALQHLAAAPVAPLRCRNSDEARYLFQAPDTIADDAWEPSDRTITFKVSQIRKRLLDAERFAEVSVVVVDYDMPRLNGIEFCREIKECPAKKIMLTGKADEVTAVAAFNERLIDGFVIKHQPDAFRRLETLIADLQASYFEELTCPLREALLVHRPAFLDDPDVNRRLRQVFEADPIVEYYVSAEPPGVVMLRADGRFRLALLQDQDALLYHFEVARDCGVAPRDLVAALERAHQTCDHQPWFPTGRGYYDRVCLPWQRHLHPAEIVGAGPWLWSVADADEALLNIQGTVVSLAAYRRIVKRTPCPAISVSSR